MLLTITIIAALLGFIYLAAHYNFWRPVVSKSHPRILMYHSIDRGIGSNHPDLVVTPENFRSHLAYLQKRGYQFLTMSEVISGNFDSAPRVALTFDDGFQDNYTEMFPVLKEFQAKATIYLCPNMPSISKLTEQQIQKMQVSGLIEFGAHTMTHINLSQVADDVAKREIIESKNEVERIIGTTCNAFSYPYGRINDRTADYVQQAGFSSSVLVKKGIEAITDPYRIKRISILGKTNFVQFHISITRGRYRV
jgi:peptidoglycan/xylan/chitin deacetylase (PgdA/CDA1 family)